MSNFETYGVGSVLPEDHAGGVSFFSTRSFRGQILKLVFPVASA